MRRSPFYAYPSFPHTFFAPPAEEAAYYHRPRRPFPSSSPEPTPPRSSVINIPVFDSPPSRPSSSFPPQKHFTTPPPSSPPAFDPSSAATTIQSCFRGFCVRKNRPLLHLRYIAKARKQLEELQSELESPGFPLKVRASEKERLRFSESVMAIILRLDAIEGSMAEVRSQRKEATKMAIKLQDAVDAIMMQKDDIADLQPTDGPSSNGGIASEDVLCEQSEEPLGPDTDMVQGGAHAVSEEGIMYVNAVIQKDESSYLQPTDDPCSDGDMAPEQDSALCEQSEEPLFCPDADLAQGGAHAVSEDGIMNVNTMDDESITPEDVVADMVDENVSRLLPLKADDVGPHTLSRSF